MNGKKKDHTSDGDSFGFSGSKPLQEVDSLLEVTKMSSSLCSFIEPSLSH
jgi:hypothetical protein